MENFLKSITLVLLLVTLGISGVFAQNDPDSDFVMKPLLEQGDFPYKPLEKEYVYQPRPEDSFITYQMPMTPEERGLKNLYQPRPEDSFITYQVPLNPEEQGLFRLINDIVEDAYITVTGDFGGEDQFFDGYPYDIDVLEDIQYSQMCDPNFLKKADESHFNDVTAFFQQIPVEDTICRLDPDYNGFFLLHPTSRGNSASEVFVIPFRNIRRSQATLTRVILEAQDVLNSADSDSYTTAVEITGLINSLLPE